MKRLKQLPIWAGRITVFALSGLASAYILMSGYESIYLRPLPFVHTIDTVNLSAFRQTYTLTVAASRDPKLYGYFGKPSTLKMPKQPLPLDIVAPLREGREGPWLARPDTFHLLIPARPRDGDIGVVLLYCRSGSQTVDAHSLPSADQNVFMDTDQGWQYVYRVTDTQVIPDQLPYVVSDDGSAGKLIIACNDAASGTDDLVIGTLLTVQGIEQ